jgi:hypothetical protein
VTGYAPSVLGLSCAELSSPPTLLDESGVGASGKLVGATGGTGATAAALIVTDVFFVARFRATFFAGAFRAVAAFFTAFFVVFLLLFAAFFAPPFLAVDFTGFLDDFLADFLAAFLADFLVDFFAATERARDLAALFFFGALPPPFRAPAVFFLLPFRAAIPSASSFWCVFRMRST